MTEGKRGKERGKKRRDHGHKDINGRNVLWEY